MPVNWRLAPAEIAAILDDAGVRFVVTDETFAPLLGEPALQSLAADALSFAASGKDFGPANLEDRIDAAAAAPAHAGSENDDALLLYTGGTTGRSKGVRLTNRNIVSNAVQNGFGLGIGFEDTWLNAAPMFHSGGPARQFVHGDGRRPCLSAAVLRRGGAVGHRTASAERHRAAADDAAHGHGRARFPSATT